MVCQPGTASLVATRRTLSATGWAPAVGGGRSAVGIGVPLLCGPDAGSGVPVSVYRKLPAQRNEIGIAVSVRMIRTGAAQNPIVLCQLKSRAREEVF
jgi:hypothetical protein